MTSSIGNVGDQEPLIKSDAFIGKEEVGVWNDLGIKVSLITISQDNKSITTKVALMFHQWLYKNSIEVISENNTYHIFLKGDDLIGRELIKLHLQGREDHIPLETLSHQEAALYKRLISQTKKSQRQIALDLLKGSKGEDSKLRRAAVQVVAPATPGEKVYENEGVIVRRKVDKKGHEKLEVFHISEATSLGKGGFSEAFKVNEEVFGESYKFKGAVLKKAVVQTADRLVDPTDDDAPLNFIKRLNGGKMPDGIQKRPKAVLKDQKLGLTKLYSEGDLSKSLVSSPVEELLKVMKGPFDALLSLKKFGIAHGDIKVENILVDALEARRQGVLGDFGRVIVFPKIPYDDPKATQEMVKEIVKLGVRDKDGKISFIASPGLSTAKEYEELRKKIENIWPKIEALSRGEAVHHDFVREYSDMKASLEKFQVMEMGVTLGVALLGREEFYRSISWKGNFISPLGIVEISLSNALKAKFPNRKQADAVYKLLEGMLNTNPQKRIGAEEAHKQFNAIVSLT